MFFKQLQLQTHLWVTHAISLSLSSLLPPFHFRSMSSSLNKNPINETQITNLKSNFCVTPLLLLLWLSIYVYRSHAFTPASLTISSHPITNHFRSCVNWCNFSNSSLVMVEVIIGCVFLWVLGLLARSKGLGDNELSCCWVDFGECNVLCLDEWLVIFFRFKDANKFFLVLTSIDFKEIIVTHVATLLNIFVVIIVLVRAKLFLFFLFSLVLMAFKYRYRHNCAETF